MKTETFLIFVLLVMLGCSQNTGNLELKEKSQIQDLSQVQVIGTRAGEIPPNFAVVSSDGRPIILSELLVEKKPIILYFMATWCPYCAEDYETLSKIYWNYDDKIIFISIDLDLTENVLDLQKYRKNYPLLDSMIFAEGDVQVLSDYSITKTTTKYIIGKNGTISYASIGALNEEQWAELLDSSTK